MTTANKEQQNLVSFATKTVLRAKRALRCAPFTLTLFLTMINQSVDLSAIALERGIRNKYTVKGIKEIKVEQELMWLIKVGILRREVDGQGITDSFRLTPLGRLIMDDWQKNIGEIPQPSWQDKILNTLNRWFSWQII